MEAWFSNQDWLSLRSDNSSTNHRRKWKNEKKPDRSEFDFFWSPVFFKFYDNSRYVDSACDFLFTHETGTIMSGFPFAT